MITKKQAIDKSYSRRHCWKTYQDLTSAILTRQELADVLLSVRIKEYKSFSIIIFLRNQHISERIVEKAVNNISERLITRFIKYQPLTPNALYYTFQRFDEQGFENLGEIRHFLRKQKNVYLLPKCIRNKLNLC